MLGWEPTGFAEFLPDLIRSYRLESNYDFKMVSPGVYRISTDNDNVGVRVVPFDEQGVQFIYDLSRHLYQQGLTRVPEVLTTREGYPSLRKSANELCYVYKWKVGRPFIWRDATLLNEAAITLGELHNGCERFAGIDALQREAWGSWPLRMREWNDRLAQWIKDLEGKKNLNAVEELMQNHGSYYLEQAEQAVAMIDSEAYFRLNEQERRQATVALRDYFPGNLLVNEANNIHLIDFDHCVADARIFDLAGFIQTVAANYNWNAETGYSLIRYYQRARTLCDDEKEILMAYLHFPRRFWLNAQQYFSGGPPLDYDTISDKLQGILVEEGKRIAFLNQLQFWLQN